MPGARRLRVMLGWLALALAFFPIQQAALAAETLVEFHIEAQDLGTALNEFALQSGREILFTENDTANKVSVRLDGRHTAEEALSILLKASGLGYRVNELNTVLVGSLSRTTTTEAAGEPPALLLAQAEPEPTAHGGRAVLDGRVIEAVTRAGMPGAQVRLVETGQTVATDHLGRFAFPDVAAGEYTLSISYLGYVSGRWPVALGVGHTTALDYPLQPAGWDLAEVTVFGNRSSRALALNQQRTAENNAEVVSADTLGNFPGTTISEALRRVAGVTFLRDGDTGAGTNIMIRGLEPDMNAVKLNGLNLPIGSGMSRSANLNNMLADSVSKITIHKTLLASHDSAGTGGLVEIETKSPLEHPERYLNFAVEGGRRGQDFGDNFLVSGTVARTLGERKNLGLSASAQYTEDVRHNLAHSTALQFGEYLPLSPLGTPTLGSGDLDPRNVFPYEPGAGSVFPWGTTLRSTDLESSTLALTASGEWQPSDRSSLRLDIQHSVYRASAFTARSSVFFGSNYQPREVAALGGEVRQALTFDGTANLGQSYGLSDGDTFTTDTISLRGSVTPGKWSFDYGAGFAHGTERSPVVRSLALGFRAADGFSEPFAPEEFLPEAVDPVEGIILSPYRRAAGKGLPLPLFTPEAWARVNDAARYDFRNATFGPARSGNDRYTGELQARYDIGGRVLRYFESGLQFETSRVEATPMPSTSANPALQFVPNPDSPFPDVIYPSLAPLGLRFNATDLGRIGHAGAGFHYLDEGAVRAFFDDLPAHARNTDVISSVDVLQPLAIESSAFSKEDNLAAYLQTRLDIGRLEVIGGVRLSRVRVRAVTVSGPHLSENGVEDQDFARDNARLLDEAVTQTDLLPRINFNYRQTDNLIFRGGYFLTTARPALEELSANERIDLETAPFYGPNGDQPQLLVQRGNPGLKPAITHNFDVGAEYYHDDIGVIRLGAFYKRIENSLQYNGAHNFQDLSGIDLPDHPSFQGVTSENTYIQVSYPVNGSDPASIWGAELHVERQFSFLPGLWSGFGMYANYSYTDSDALLRYPWFEPQLDADGNVASYVERRLEFPGERFNYQTENAATIALTYNRRGIDATLTWGFQDRYQSQFTPNNLDSFSEGVSALDLRVAYFFDWRGVKLRTFLEGTDLLKGATDSDLLSSIGGVGGIGKYYADGTYLGGRELRMGISATF